MPVKIHGNDYATVAERIELAHSQDAIRSIECRIVSPLESKYVVVQAVLTTTKGVFTGYAEEIRGTEGIGGESPVEVAETSAVGRALAFAGYGGSSSVKSIASADEMKSKLARKPMPKVDVKVETVVEKVPGIGADEIASAFDGKALEMCSGCGIGIDDAGGFKAKDIVAFSKRKFGKAYCINCQKVMAKGAK